MKQSYAKDIICTLVIKLTLLFLLWFFCIKGNHPHLSNHAEWLLGNNKPFLLTPNDKEVTP